MKKNALTVYLFLFFLIKFNFSLSAQEDNGLLNLHINCRGCDMNYVRQNISYLNHVRDQGLADVQAFILPIDSGNGGRVFELTFTGFKDFEGLDQQLVYETTPNQTGDEVREGLLKRIEAGLLPYLLKTGMADQITIKIEEPEGLQSREAVTEAIDPWNYWIFEIRGSGDIEKESQRDRFNWEVGFEADRITEEWKMGGDVEFSTSESRFQDDDEEFISIRNGHRLNFYAINSLGKHWSAGLFGNVRHSTFQNLDLTYSLTPALEYSLYPYKEAIRREITLVYRLGLRRNHYIDETIYGETRETLGRQSMALRFRFRQPWGSLFASLQASNYLHDFSKNRVQLNSWMNIRLFQGFNLRLSTDLQLVRDLITLPAGESSLEDILLRQRQIATDFTMEFGIGFSYTFGSAFNSIVNPRL